MHKIIIMLIKARIITAHSSLSKHTHINKQKDDSAPLDSPEHTARETGRLWPPNKHKIKY